MKTTELNFKSLSIILSCWCAIGLLHLMTGYLDIIRHNKEHVIALSDLVYYLLAYMSWALFSALLFLILSRLFAYRSLSYIVIIYFAGTVLWLPSFFIIDSKLAGWLYDIQTPTAIDLLRNLSTKLVFFYFIVYTLTFIFCAAVIYYQLAKASKKKSLELEAKHAKTQLMLAELHIRELQSQLSPHFLFNCLNSISALARSSKTEELVTAVAQLGELLRFTLEASQEKLIDIFSEVLFVENYISLQKLRFENRFTYTIEKNHISGEMCCPPFLLQSLVEHAFTYFVTRTKEMVAIKANIASDIDNINLTVEVCDSLNALNTEDKSNAFINLKKRLDILYGENLWSLENKFNDNYKVEVTIPLKKIDE